MAQRPDTNMAAIVRCSNHYETAIARKRKGKYSDVPTFP